MAQINNSELTKELKEGGKIQQLRDVIPSQLADKVVPVMEVNPKLLRRAKAFAISSSLTNATSSNIFNSSADKDTYITTACLTMIKDATSTATSIAMNVVNDEGQTNPILRFAAFTLTAQYDTITISFPTPLKIKRGSSITITSDTAVANITARGALTGYEIDNSSA